MSIPEIGYNFYNWFFILNPMTLNEIGDSTLISTIFKYFSSKLVLLFNSYFIPVPNLFF